MVLETDVAPETWLHPLPHTDAPGLRSRTAGAHMGG